MIIEAVKQLYSIVDEWNEYELKHKKKKKEEEEEDDMDPEERVYMEDKANLARFNLSSLDPKVERPGGFDPDDLDAKEEVKTE